MASKRNSLLSETSKVVAVRLSKVDADIIRDVAEQHGITRSDVIRWAIAEWEERNIESIRRSTNR